MSEKVFSNVYNVSGTHSYQQVTGDAIFQNKFFDFLKGGKIMAVRTQLFDFLTEKRGADSQRVGFPCRIDVRQNHPVRMGKGMGEFVEKSFRAGIGMRLKNAPERFVRIVGGGLQS